MIPARPPRMPWISGPRQIMGNVSQLGIRPVRLSVTAATALMMTATIGTITAEFAPVISILMLLITGLALRNDVFGYRIVRTVNLGVDCFAEFLPYSDSRYGN